MEIEIKNRFTGSIILCGEYESIKECLEKNRGADLRGADLEGADLEGAYLEGAYLRGADYNGEKLEKEPIQILGLKYFVFITKEQIKIGCELHKATEWKDFDDKRIIGMGGKKGLEWWKEHKDLILKVHEVHKLTPN